MPSHHIIISGTGRSGTTFLVQLFTALDLETGFSDPQSGLFPNCNAGMEFDLRLPDAPYIVKSPNLCDYLDEALENGDVVIDHVLVPMRDLFSAAESRREVMRTTNASLYPDGIPGGLWHTDEPNKQELILADRLYKLIYTISKKDIPLTLLFFPRLIHEPEYLYRKLGFMLSEVTYPEFLERFQQIAKPHLVHDFGPAAEKPMSSGE